MDMRKKILDNIHQAKTFLILTHYRPDGDAISSSLAMFYFLVGLGKNPEDIDVYIPYISNDLSFIDKNNIRKENSILDNYDLIIVVDCSDYSRIEGNDLLEGVSSQQCIVIDHHEMSGIPIEADCSLIDASASSTTCIIYRQLSKYMCKQNSNDFFRCSAIGIMSDTIGLTLNVTQECKDILNECEKVGVDIPAIRTQLKNIDARTQTLAKLAIERLALDKGIGCTYILQKDLVPEESSLKTLNHKSIIQQILNSGSCKTLILLIENDNHEIKGSMRTTESNIDLNAICADMVERNIFIQGGGHSNSAGFKMAISDTEKETLNRIFKLLITAILG